MSIGYQIIICPVANTLVRHCLTAIFINANMLKHRFTLYSCVNELQLSQLILICPYKGFSENESNTCHTTYKYSCAYK